MMTECVIPRCEVEIRRDGRSSRFDTSPAEITLVPGRYEEVIYGNERGFSCFDNDDRIDTVDAVVDIPWVPNIYGDLDTMVDYFEDIAKRLRLAKEDLRSGHRKLGPVE